MTEENRPTLLHYASPPGPDSAREIWWRGALRRCGQIWKSISLPVVAIILLLPIYAAQYFEWPPLRINGWFGYRFSLFIPFVALFLPGALRRINARSFVIALCGAGIAFGISQLQDLATFRGFFFYIDLSATAMILLLLAMSEKLAKRDRGWAKFQWPVIGVVAAACFVTVIAHYISLAHVSVVVGNTKYGSASAFFRPVILAVVAWFMLVWSGRAAESRGWQRKTFVFISTGFIALWVGFFVIALMPLARRSLLGKGPFARGAAAWLIDQSGNAADVERIYPELDHSDWTEAGEFDSVPEWKRNCVAVLSDRDPHAAERLSQMLLAHPSSGMAEGCAWLLAKDHRYETAPLLLRYAFVNLTIHRTVPCNECVKALEDMGVPDVAEYIILHQWDHQARSGYKPQFGTETREQLTKLLGKDLGAEPVAWQRFYRQNLDSLPNPLPAHETRDVKELISAIQKYRATGFKLNGVDFVIPRSLAEPNVNLVTTEEFAREVNNYVDAVDRAIADRERSQKEGATTQP